MSGRKERERARLGPRHLVELSHIPALVVTSSEDSGTGASNTGHRVEQATASETLVPRFLRSARLHTAQLVRQEASQIKPVHRSERAEYATQQFLNQRHPLESIACHPSSSLPFPTQPRSPPERVPSPLCDRKAWYARRTSRNRRCIAANSKRVSERGSRHVRKSGDVPTRRHRQLQPCEQLPSTVVDPSCSSPTHRYLQQPLPSHPS